ncbi:single-stranded DNA-binding protein [Novosphingobium barchaimii LL02]|uniref:Single-stranded DNA-binding protein n=1 Tax=Novosphingobium barchaimii LL02 TaxID=1114963 RepID=A0A0J7Y687_9SPHN|nr:single-stranded DNA-binding protein [Novosphingobium barchaimii]KMS59152.1 single-stranded DNA-binding protein [Novosphingobium barchaimii LL02]
MSDINICTFTGRLGADPEVKSFQSGGRICNLRMAVGQQWKDKASGERKERTEWVQVTIQNDGLVGVAERFLRKGSRIAISGEFRTRKWQDQNGNDRYSTEIVLSPFGGTLTMLDGKPEGEQQGRARGNDQRNGDDRGGERSTGSWGREPDGSRGGSSWGSGAGGFGDDLDDDIPFITNASAW